MRTMRKILSIMIAAAMGTTAYADDYTFLTVQTNDNSTDNTELASFTTISFADGRMNIDGTGKTYNLTDLHKMYFSPSTVNGIDAVEVENRTNSDGYWYSLQGQRIEKPTQKGIYIHDGKKIVIR